MIFGFGDVGGPEKLGFVKLVGGGGGERMIGGEGLEEAVGG